jgi:hypothetical protein
MKIFVFDPTITGTGCHIFSKKKKKKKKNLANVKKKKKYLYFWSFFKKRLWFIFQARKRVDAAVSVSIGELERVFLQRAAPFRQAACSAKFGTQVWKS